MDISDTIAPKSDQLDAVDLLSGARTFTIAGVSRGTDEQPVQIALADFPRPWRPGLSMRRVLVSCWGKDAATYVGRRVTLYCDPDVQFGGAAVGGTRIKALSHIDKPKQVPLLVKRGKSAIFTVQPLADSPPPPPSRAPAVPITPNQLTALNAALANDLGLTDRDDKLAYLSGELGRDIASSKEITKDEASRLLDSIKTWAEPAAEVTTPEPPLDEGGAR